MSVRSSRTIPLGAEHLPKAAVFAAVARAGSFSKAAAELGMGKSTVSQHVRSLETALGVRLVHRTTRQMRLTEEGEFLFRSISDALNVWDDALAALAAKRDEPEGLLRVTSPGGIASQVVTRVFCELMNRFPGVRTELLLDDRLRDLVKDGVDVALRMAPMEDSSMILRRLGETHCVFVAAPHVASRVDHTSIEDLKNHRYVAHGAVPHQHVNVWSEEGKPLEIPVETHASAWGTEAQIALVQGGAGIALMPELMIRPSVEAGRLVRVYPGYRGRKLPIYALYPARHFTPPRVTYFLEMLEAAIRSQTETESSA